MTASAEFIALIVDLLADVGTGSGPVSVRRMFGGAGVYGDGVMFALVIGDTLYFKADAETKLRFEAEGERPFVYDGKTRPVAMSYWRVPDRLLDDGDELTVWAREAIAVARRTSAARSRTRTRPGG